MDDVEGVAVANGVNDGLDGLCGFLLAV